MTSVNKARAWEWAAAILENACMKYGKGQIHVAHALVAVVPSLRRRAAIIRRGKKGR